MRAFVGGSDDLYGTCSVAVLAFPGIANKFISHDSQEEHHHQSLVHIILLEGPIFIIGGGGNQYVM